MRYNEYMENSAKLSTEDRIEAIKNQIQEEYTWLGRTCNPKKVRYRKKYIKSLKKQLEELREGSLL